MKTINCEPVPCGLCGASGGVIEASGYDYQYQTAKIQFFFIKCQSCGHTYLSPRPTAEALPQIYPETYYTKDGRHQGKVGFIKKYVIRRRLAFFQNVFKKGGHILELGCGDGALLLDIKSRYPQCTVSGLDLSFASALEKQCQSHHIRLIQADLETLDLSKNTYDLIIMNQLIEHLREPAKTLPKIVRALKPGGMISIETPNLDGYDRNWFKKSFWGGYYFPRHMHLFDGTRLKELLNAQKLDIVQQYSLVAPIIWIFSVSAALGHLWGPTKPPGNWFFNFFNDKNIGLLGFFAALDALAIQLGATTANQKVIAQKPIEKNNIRHCRPSSMR